MSLKVGLFAVVVLACSVASASAEVTLRFSDYGPNRGARAEALEWFASQLKSRTNGQVKINFYWGGSLLSGKETLGGIASGVADMGTIVGFFTPKKLQFYNIGDLPVKNSDMRVGMHAMYDLSRENPQLKKEFKDAGVRYVTNYTTGPVQLICKRKVSNLDELKGLKIRASGPYRDTLERLGVQAISLSQANVYQALDSGLVDCNQGYYYQFLAYRQNEVAHNVLELNWGQNMSFGVAISPASYNQMTDEQKRIFDKVASEFIDHLVDTMEAETKVAKSKMQNAADGAGITVRPITEEDAEKLEKASRVSIDDWIKRVGKEGSSVLADYEQDIRKHSAQNH